MVLTTFSDFNPSYSLCSVVESQLKALVKNGYETILATHDNFKDDDKVPKGVTIKKIVPRFLLVDYAAQQEVNADFDTQVQKIYEAFKENTKDIDVIFAHDLIFQGWFLPYCSAIHKLASETKIKWFHWVHSVPNPMPNDTKYPHTLRYTMPANSKLVYLNNFHIIRAAEAYRLFPKDVRVVYNPVDPRLFYNLHPLVLSLLDKYAILEADFVQVYPVSTPRMIGGKGLKTVIDIFASLKREHRKVVLIVCNAHANDRREKQVIAETLSYASQQGLSSAEVIFTSLEDPIYELGVPREVVSQLFQLSNLFIFPSISENCSLILLEAMLSKVLLILNESVGSMREFGKENALYFKFGGLDETVNYNDRDNFMKDVAKIIISEFERNRALKASNEVKKNFNYQTIFERQILPLLHEN